MKSIRVIACKYLKRIRILVVIVLMTAFCGNAQPYKPLLDDFNEWHFTNCYFGCVTPSYYTDGDTVVEGLAYKVLDGYHYISRTILLREEVENRHVYLTRILPNKIQHFLLYDFSKEEGDTMELFNPMAPFENTPGYFRLDSIRMKPLYDEVDYRHFYWSPVDGNLLPDSYPVWVEGVGSLSLINAPAGHPDINGVGQLSCFFKNGNLFYSDLDSITSCIPEHFLNISLPSDETIVPSVFPNPSLGMIFWDVEDVVTISVYDAKGNELIHKNVDAKGNDGGKELDINNLSNGVYFVKFGIKNGTQNHTKIVLMR